jgi:phytoene dehydrogenase-like protein
LSKPDYDTIVVGGGHNGLTAAAYLAQAGQRVLVLEALARLGGFCTTDTYLPNAPGFAFSPHALDHVLTGVPPSIVTELHLARFGLDYIEIDPFGGWIGPDGTRLVLWRDLPKTVAAIAQLSLPDAAAYQLLIDQGRALWRIAIPYLMDHPTRPSWRTIAQILRAALASRGQWLNVARLALQPASAMIASRFTHPALRSLLTNLAASGGIPVDATGSAILATVLAIEHDYGVHRPRGGSGAFIDALAACTRHHGGDIRTGAPVDQILIDQNTATGVLCRGQPITARAVLAAMDPVSLSERLIGAGRLPPAACRELSGIGQFRPNLGMGAIGACLTQAPTLPDSTPQAFLAASLYLGPDDAGIAQAVAEARAGHIPAQLPVWLVLPSIADRSLVPPGSSGETLYAYLPVLPRHLAAGAWADARNDLYQRAKATLDHHLPGLSNLVRAHFVHTPDDLALWSHDSRGGPYHADLSLDQLGPWRPVPSFSGYRTPVRSLYHAGAGAHPLGTLNGWSGRSAARLILKAR